MPPYIAFVRFFRVNVQSHYSFKFMKCQGDVTPPHQFDKDANWIILTNGLVTFQLIF
jgi:hypothetical protein